MSIAAYQGVCPTCRYDHSADTLASTTRETADHAELKRLAEAATPGPWHAAGGYLTVRDPDSRSFSSTIYHLDEMGQKGPSLPYQAVPFARHSDAAFISAANPATVLALLSEIAALRSALDVCNTARLHWQEVVVPALGDRATQAERQRDELRKALEWYGEQARLARLIHREGDAGRHALADDGGKRARQAIANQGADQ